MNSPFIKLTAVSLSLVDALLRNAQTDMGTHGGAVDLPTARYAIEQAIKKLDQITQILEHPNLCPVVTLPAPRKTCRRCETRLCLNESGPECEVCIRIPLNPRDF